MSEQYCAKCERCHEEGLRDDEDCPYYGEPNGCNHPKYGYDEKKETWIEIVADMRKQYDCGACEEFVEPLVKKIEAACKTLEAENAKLRRAIDPVMKYEANAWIETPAMAYAAIRAAQAIMKE